jgi:integrase
VWRPATVRAGLDGLRWHDLRHTHVAFLIEAGVHVKAIQSRLGHSSISTTLDVYGHLFEGIDEAAAAALPAPPAPSTRPQVIEMPRNLIEN